MKIALSSQKNREMTYYVFGTFTPVFLTVGPLFMVFSGQEESQTTMFYIYGFGGALGLGFGLVYLFIGLTYLFRMVHSLKNELDELNHHDKLTE